MKFNYREYENLIDKYIDRAYILLYPPTYADSIYELDMSINIVFKEYKSISFTTAKNGWTSIIKDEKVYPDYNFDDFNSRINHWMNFDDFDNLPTEKEVFEIKNKQIDIIGKKIEEICFYVIDNEKDFNPHGIKLIFSDETYVISTCGHDGNLVQTTNFLNEIDLLNRFKEIGEIEIIKLKEIIKYENVIKEKGLG